MDEQALRQRLCRGVEQLWARGAIAGAEGLVSMELTPRRFLATPHNRRRADLTPADLVVVDIGGVDVGGSGSLPPEIWRAHRLAYQTARDTGDDAFAQGRVQATVLAAPPALLAAGASDPTARELRLFGMPPVPVVDGFDEEALRQALQASRLVVLRSVGLLSVAPDLSIAINAVEAADHAATVDLLQQARRG